MSDHKGGPANPNTVVIVAGTVVGVVFLVVIGAMAIAIEDGARAASMIGIVVPSLAALLAFLALFRVVVGLGQDVREVKTDTNDLVNGTGSAKIRHAVSQVVDDRFIDPAVRPQLLADRERLARRAAAVEAAERLVEPHADLD